MTVSNENVRIDHTAPGGIFDFAFDFRILVKADLQVYLDGVLQTLVTHYDITGVDVAGGGTVTFVVATSAGQVVTIIRAMAMLQPVDYTAGEKFPAETHERALDRATFQIQERNEEIKRSLRIGLFSGDPADEMVLGESAAVRAGRVLGFTEDGKGLSTLTADADSATEAAASAAEAAVSADEAAASAAEAATELPQNSKSANYTLVLDDAGGHLLHPVTDDNPRTFTIPANASVAFPLGTTVTFVNRKNVLTIAITTDTLVLAKAGTTGSVTMAANGLATALKIAPTVWLIGGTGIGITETDDIKKAIMDAKGDLISASAADTPVRKAVGANRSILEADSSQSDGLAWVARALGLKSVQVFTSSGTWTRPTGIRKVLVEVVGGGGSGGGTALDTASAGGGGGGGGFASRLVDVTGIASATVTVGSGGAAPAAGANAGNAGGASSWADGVNTVTGNGGAAGPAPGAVDGGAGGTATGGNINISGGQGGAARAAASEGANGGGASQRGAGGAPRPFALVSGQAGSLFGGGGGGARNPGTGAAQAGGAGAAGVVIAYEYE